MHRYDKAKAGWIVESSLIILDYGVERAELEQKGEI